MSSFIHLLFICFQHLASCNWLDSPNPIICVHSIKLTDDRRDSCVPGLDIQINSLFSENLQKILIRLRLSPNDRSDQKHARARGANLTSEWTSSPVALRITNYLVVLINWTFQLCLHENNNDSWVSLGLSFFIRENKEEYHILGY